MIQYWRVYRVITPDTVSVKSNDLVLTYVQSDTPDTVSVKSNDSVPTCVQSDALKRTGDSNIEEWDKDMENEKSISNNNFVNKSLHNL